MGNVNIGIIVATQEECVPQMQTYPETHGPNLCLPNTGVDQIINTEIIDNLLSNDHGQFQKF